MTRIREKFCHERGDFTIWEIMIQNFSTLYYAWGKQETDAHFRM
jgi:hypothetical protein